MATKKTPKRNADHLEPYRWKPGQPSPNPAGRPPGKSFLQAHREEWDRPAPLRVLKSLAKVMFGEDQEEAAKWLKESMGKVTWMQAIVHRDNFKAVTPDGDFIVKTMWEQNDGRPTVRITGADDGPVQIQSIDYKNLSSDELKLLRELIAKVTVKGD